MAITKDSRMNRGTKRCSEQLPEIDGGIHNIDRELVPPLERVGTG